MGFNKSTADPCVWLQNVVKAYNEEYYEYVLVYFDDILSISVNWRYDDEDRK